MLDTVIWVVVLVWLLSRQIRKRPIGGKGSRSGRLRSRSSQLILLLVGVGTIQLIIFLGHNKQWSSQAISILALSFLIGGLLGVIRAHTVHIWRDGERFMRQGTWITVTLWLIATASHLGADVLIEHHGGPAGTGTATMLLFLGFAVFIQTTFLRRRIRRVVIKERRRERYIQSMRSST